MPRGLQKFSFLTRDKTQVPAVEAQIFNNWAAREVCPFFVKNICFQIKQEARKGDREDEITA